MVLGNFRVLINTLGAPNNISISLRVISIAVILDPSSSKYISLVKSFPSNIFGLFLPYFQNDTP